jgi:hypothetical protein
VIGLREEQARMIGVTRRENNEAHNNTERGAIRAGILDGNME